MTTEIRRVFKREILRLKNILLWRQLPDDSDEALWFLVGQFEDAAKKMMAAAEEEVELLEKEASTGAINGARNTIVEERDELERRYLRLAKAVRQRKCDEQWEALKILVDEALGKEQP